jgi:hypothetical protein
VPLPPSPRRSTEADPDVLAKYVLALLREGTPRDVLEAQCREQLDAFLGAGARKRPPMHARVARQPTGARSQRSRHAAHRA